MAVGLLAINFQVAGALAFPTDIWKEREVSSAKRVPTTSASVVLGWGRNDCTHSLGGDGRQSCRRGSCQRTDVSQTRPVDGLDPLERLPLGCNRLSRLGPCLDDPCKPDPCDPRLNVINDCISDQACAFCSLWMTAATFFNDLFLGNARFPG